MLGKGRTNSRGRGCGFQARTTICWHSCFGPGGNLVAQTLAAEQLGPSLRLLFVLWPVEGDADPGCGDSWCRLQLGRWLGGLDLCQEPSAWGHRVFAFMASHEGWNRAGFLQWEEGSAAPPWPLGTCSECHCCFSFSFQARKQNSCCEIM